VDGAKPAPDASTLRGKDDPAIDLVGFQFTFNIDRWSRAELNAARFRARSNVSSAFAPRCVKRT